MKAFLTILILFISQFLMGQNTVYKITYDFHINLQEFNYREAKLLFNTNESVFYWGEEEYQEQDLNKDNEHDFAIPLSINDSIGSINYIDHKKDSLISRMPYLSNKVYIVREQKPSIDWTITKEEKKIGPYACQKAIGKFRGRMYTAWFTLDIPLNMGPWKLQGLPGLILEASDTDKLIQFAFTSLQETDEEINPPIHEGIFIGLTEYKDLLNGLGNDIIKKLNARLPRNAHINVTKHTSIEIFENEN